MLLVFRSLPEEEGEPIAWSDLSAQVGPLRIARAERRLFRERPELVAYLRRYAGGRAAVPEVDFRRRQLLLVTAGPRSSTGYGVEVLDVRDEGGRLVVRVRERAPRLEERVEPGVTRPYRLISLPAGEEVDVDWLGR